jgi:hypothetical protein
MHVFGEEPRECWLHCCFGWIDESFWGGFVVCVVLFGFLVYFLGGERGKVSGWKLARAFFCGGSYKSPEQELNLNGS